MGNACSTRSIIEIEDIKLLGVRVNDEQSFSRIRELLLPEKIWKFLYNEGFVDDDGQLTTGTKPFNAFARYASSAMTNDAPQYGISQEFMICHNRPDNDAEWNDSTSKRGSMAGPDENGPGHVFMTSRNLHWTKFNILTINDVSFLERMKKNAQMYTDARGWKNYGLYFHCFPLNSVQSLHLHIVNLDTIGPHYATQQTKNLSIDDAISVIANN